MGKQVVELTKVTDDLDGSDLSDNPPEAQTITFDGKKYEVYLSARSTERLLDFLSGVQPLTTSGSRPSTSSRGGGKRGPNRTPEEIAAEAAAKEAKKQQRADIQAWAKNADGFAVPGEQGKISQKLLDAFYKANPKAERLF